MTNGAICPTRTARDPTTTAASGTLHMRGGMAAAPLASIGSISNDADQARRRSLRGPSSTFACVGIDPDMGGAIALLTFDRDDTILRDPPAEGRDPLAEWCQSGMSNVTAQVWDMPTYKYRLASGKLKRRVCGLEFHRTLTECILRSDAVRHARSTGRMSLVIERPTPIPDIDGWQSAALSAYTFGVLMGALASEGMVSRDQEMTASQSAEVSHHIIEIQAIQWKRQMQLQGTGKDTSRELALQLIPELSSQLKRKKDHGRAEAVLLAIWGAFMSDAHLAQRKAVAAVRRSKRGTKGAFSEKQQHERLQALFPSTVRQDGVAAEDVVGEKSTSEECSSSESERSDTDGEFEARWRVRWGPEWVGGAALELPAAERVHLVEIIQQACIAKAGSGMTPRAGQRETGAQNRSGHKAAQRRPGQLRTGNPDNAAAHLDCAQQVAQKQGRAHAQMRSGEDIDGAPGVGRVPSPEDPAAEGPSSRNGAHDSAAGQAPLRQAEKGHHLLQDAACGNTAHVSEDTARVPVKRGRGRPRKHPAATPGAAEPRKYAPGAPATHLQSREYTSSASGLRHVPSSAVALAGACSSPLSSCIHDAAGVRASENEPEKGHLKAEVVGCSSRGHDREEVTSVPVKRGRGRPRKHPPATPAKRGRGRPRKYRPSASAA